MYNYRHRRFGWLPVLLVFLVLITLFSGGFHHPWFFFGPLFLCFPFFVAAGLGALFMARRRFGYWPKHKHDGSYFSEKPKGDDDSEIFYA